MSRRISTKKRFPERDSKYDNLLVSLLVNRFKIKDSLIYMSDISIRSTDSLFKLRGLNESIDSVKISLIFEDLIFGFLKNNKQKSILVKVRLELPFVNTTKTTMEYQ